MRNSSSSFITSTSLLYIHHLPVLWVRGPGTPEGVFIVTLPLIATMFAANMGVHPHPNHHLGERAYTHHSFFYHRPIWKGPKLPCTSTLIHLSTSLPLWAKKVFHQRTLGSRRGTPSLAAKISPIQISNIFRNLDGRNLLCFLFFGIFEI